MKDLLKSCGVMSHLNSRFDNLTRYQVLDTGSGSRYKFGQQEGGRNREPRWEEEFQQGDIRGEPCLLFFDDDAVRPPPSYIVQRVQASSCISLNRPWRAASRQLARSISSLAHVTVGT